MGVVMTDSFTKFGAIVGLLTGIFTVWDRLLRNRPIAYFHVRGPKGSPFRYVRVKNIDQSDIQIIDIKCWPDIFRVAKDHSVDGIVRATFGQPPLQFVAPDARCDFPVVETPGVAFNALKLRY